MESRSSPFPNSRFKSAETTTCLKTPGPDSTREDESFPSDFSDLEHHDSGYESVSSRPCLSRQRTSRSEFSSLSRFHKRPIVVVHRPPNSASVSRLYCSNAGQRRPSLRLHDSHHQPARTCLQSPDYSSLEPASDEIDRVLNSRHAYPMDVPPPVSIPATPLHDESSPILSLPSPTTCYWTSDRTRRLEYAAIDAASRGVRGWFLSLVPDCIIPKDCRRVRFEDDRGSVIRYRLDLEDDEHGENDERSIAVKKRKRWWS